MIEPETGPLKLPQKKPATDLSGELFWIKSKKINWPQCHSMNNCQEKKMLRVKLQNGFSKLTT